MIKFILITFAVKLLISEVNSIANTETKLKGRKKPFNFIFERIFILFMIYF